MADLILKPGDIISLKAKIVHRTNKAPFQKQDGQLRYQYYITMENAKGDVAVCEYLSLKETQDEFFQGAYQYIKVMYLSPKGTPEIIPCEESTKNIVPTEVKGVTPGNTSHVDIPAKGVTSEHNCSSVPANGKAITYATAYAKDILVAEISGNPRKITEEDIRRMMSWADIINQGICDRIAF